MTLLRDAIMGQAELLDKYGVIAFIYLPLVVGCVIPYLIMRVLGATGYR